MSEAGDAEGEEERGYGDWDDESDPAWPTDWLPAAKLDYIWLPDVAFEHKHPFLRLCLGHFTKYPSKYVPDVLDAHVVEEIEKDSIVFRRREIRVTNIVPWVIRKALGAWCVIDSVIGSVGSTVDPI